MGAKTTRNLKGLIVRMAAIVMIVFVISIPQYAVAQNQNLTARCSVSPIAINMGERAVWTVEASGGNGSYEYFWTGSDNLIGNNESVAKIYARSGTQTATVTVYSGGQSVAPTCNLIVLDIFQTLTGSCSPQASTLRESEAVVWTANSFGGDGGYRYFWSGTDDLEGSGQSVSRLYNFPGRKDATVVITSDGQSTVRECSVTIEPDPELEGECYADSTSISSGNPVTWTALASGGTGEYRYSWYGGNLRGNYQAISEIYEGLGERTASVEIVSGSQSIIRTCSVEVVPGGEVLGAFYGGPGASIPPADIEGLLPEDGEETKQFSYIGWKILSTLIVLIGAAVLAGMIVYFKKLAKEEEEKQILAGPGEGPLKDIAEIIQSEAHKREVIISSEAILLLMEKTHNSITEGVTHLHSIIDELKKIPTGTVTVVDAGTADKTTEAEVRFLVIDEEVVKKHFASIKK